MIMSPHFRLEGYSMRPFLDPASPFCLFKMNQFSYPQPDTLSRFKLLGEGASMSSIPDRNTHPLQLCVYELVGSKSVSTPKHAGNEVELHPKARRTSPLPKLQRQKGWLLIQKARKCGKVHDKFYRHIQSGVQFRSKNEVDDFINHGLLLKQPHKRRQEVQQQESVSNDPSDKRRAKKWKFVASSYDSNVFDVEIYD